MSIRRNLVHLLDRPGGRSILGRIASRFAKRQTGVGVEIFFDGLWAHRVGSYCFPDSRRFEYYATSLENWKNQSQECLSNADDFWFRHYRPEEGDVIVDIGAGRGEDTLAFSEAVGRTGRVVAIEADPRSFELLAAFCRLNRLANTTPLHVAVMDQPGVVRMTQSDDWFENRVDASDQAAGVEVPATTLKAICESQGIKRIDFLKMNIEGSERYALPGIGDLIDQIQSICVACHDFFAARGYEADLQTRAFVERFLTDRGFTVFSRPDDPRDYVRDHLFGVRCK